jgi:hypothetical protein
MVLIRLAEASPTVRWFFPSEFAGQIRSITNGAQKRSHQMKLAIRKFIRENTKQLNVTYVVVGPYFDL